MLEGRWTREKGGSGREGERRRGREREKTLYDERGSVVSFVGLRDYDLGHM
jgi:hypothetical protein